MHIFFQSTKALTYDPVSAAPTSVTLPQAKTLWNRNELLTKPPLAKSHHSSGPDRTRAAGGLEDWRFAWEKGALNYTPGSATNWPHDLGQVMFHASGWKLLTVCLRKSLQCLWTHWKTWNFQQKWKQGLTIKLSLASGEYWNGFYNANGR